MSKYDKITLGTDGGFADRFADQHGSDLRYIPELDTWVEYSGTCWARADVNKRARQTATRLYDEIKDVADGPEKELVFRWAKRSHNSGSIRSMLYQARDKLRASQARFDADPEVINCLNGVVDLRTGALLPHSPDQYVLKQAKAEYHPGAPCPRWLAFLDEVLEENQELIDWLQVALGYSITGLVDEHCFFLLKGTGRNGKGTIGETVMDILGSYAAPTDIEAFLSGGKTNVRAMAAVGNLKGLRFVLGSETNINVRFDEALIKRLTGGDTRTGTKLHSDSFTYKPTDKLWFLTNNMPAIKDASIGMWERVKVIPFNKTYDETNKDTKLMRQLLSERNGVFAWLVEGAKKYLELGLPPTPQVVHAAVQEYRDTNDTLSKFINECLERSTPDRIGVGETHRRYEDWCQRNDVDDLVSRNFFRQRMNERGIKSKADRNGSNFFLGYKLKEERKAAKTFDGSWNGLALDRQENDHGIPF